LFTFDKQYIGPLNVARGSVVDHEALVERKPDPASNPFHDVCNTVGGWTRMGRDA
jgi:hypothetical protein